MSGIIPPLHPAGWPFVWLFAGVTVILAVIWGPLGWAGALLTLWCAYFFRDPERVTQARDGLVISP
ncbi:MAG: phosphatidylserine decarboxylase family protein, partial [Alphaproteobacteria bacterium]|nr:phosphatidylserine decarboxylase family protein [Alphaproteobacteria bacterium]